MQPILSKNERGDDVIVNFHPALTSLIKETRNLERLGFDIPAEARGVALQSEKYSAYRCTLSKMLAHRRDVLDSLSPLERQLFRTRVAVLNGASLHRGLKTYNWNSLGIPDFVAAYTTELNDFTTVVDGVRTHAGDLERSVKKISVSSFVDCEALSKSGVERESGELFAQLAAQCSKTASVVREEYVNIMNLLLRVEEIVFGTRTGKVVHLREYYALLGERDLRRSRSRCGAEHSSIKGVF